MFKFSVKPYKRKDGTMTSVILVTGDDVDSTYPFKDEMKNRFGASWISSLKTWGWWGSPDMSVVKNKINNYVRPAIEFLLANEKNKTDDSNARNVDSIVDELLSAFDNSDTEEEIAAANNVYMTKNEIQAKIQEFKENLVSIVNGDEFKRLMMPIINARRAQGYKYSLKNTILIWIQDPKAKLVKSRRKWAAFNRQVKPNAPAIGMFVPVGQKEFSGRDARKRATEKWLKDNGFNSVNELDLGEKEILKTYLNSVVGDVMFKFSYSFFDQRFTEPIPGKEDLLGDIDSSKIPWFDDSGKETNAVKEKIYALLKVVGDSGVNVSKTKNLGGALGVSKGGTIEVLSDATMNFNYLMTLTHEFAHEMLHQVYLKNSSKEWGQFYSGFAHGHKYVEQQAELTAWIVCRFYGYNVRESINYAGIWGMDAKNAVNAFNSVASVSDFIINKMNEKIKEARGNNNVQESRRMINEVNYSGLDIAKMVGAEELYMKGLEELEEQEEMTENFKKNFSNVTKKINESDRKRLNTVFD